jgi:hypothetical protein
MVVLPPKKHEPAVGAKLIVYVPVETLLGSKKPPRTPVPDHVPDGTPPTTSVDKSIGAFDTHAVAVAKVGAAGAFTVTVLVPGSRQLPPPVGGEYVIVKLPEAVEPASKVLPVTLGPVQVPPGAAGSSNAVKSSGCSVAQIVASSGIALPLA